MSRINGRYASQQESAVNNCSLLVSGGIVKAINPPEPLQLVVSGVTLDVTPVNNRDIPWYQLVEDTQEPPIKIETHSDVTTTKKKIGRKLRGNRVVELVLNLTDENTPPMTGGQLWKKAFCK